MSSMVNRSIPIRRVAGEPPEVTGTSPITIEDYGWIANDATVLPGVTIGRGAVVGSSAVVTEDVPELAVVAGVQARVVRTIPKPTAWVRRPTLSYLYGKL